MPSTTWRVYENWKNVKGLTSDRAACSALGLSHGATVYWRSGKNASADVLARMARDLGHSDSAIAGMVLEAAAESSTANAEAARVLRKLAARIAVLSVVLALSVAPVLAYASTAASSCKERTLNIMSSVAYVATTLWVAACAALQCWVGSWTSRAASLRA